MAALLALASAVSFGASDFAGGMAARRMPAVSVSVLAQISGLLLLVPALLVTGGQVSRAALATGAAAGLFGASGLVLYLRALAIGPMGVASPLAAVVGALVPVTVGLAAGERPSAWALGGIVLGLVAIVLVSWSSTPGSAREDVRGPGMALIGGLGFGGFFVALDATPTGSGLWPLLGARASSLALLLALLAVMGGFSARGGALSLAALAGLLDMLANILFLAATRSGLLSLAALIASLYPVVVAGLAYRVLGERLSARQRLGAVVCLLAVGLIAAG